MATTRHTTKMMASLTRPFPEVLRRAKRGTSKDLSLLCARLDEDTLSVEVFRFLLQHFDRTHIPTVRRDGISDAQLKGLMVSFTLPDVVKIVKSDQAVKGRLLDGIVDEILKVFEDIIAWLNHNIDYGLSIPMDKDPQDFLTAYVGNANVLYSLLDLSPRVLDALYSSPCATDLVIKLWVTKNWGKIHTRMTVFNERCPIHVLLLHCIDTIDGKRLFSDKVRVYQCEGLPERFLGGVAQRIAVWKGLLEAKTILPEGAAMHYLDMCDVVLHLMADPVFQRAAVSIGIWSVMIPPIEVMARVGRAELILACLNHVISAAVLISATRTRNCYDLLQNGDLIAIFIRVIEKSLNPDSLMLALCILKMLVTMCHFPEVPDWLSDLLNGRFRALTKKLEDHPQEELRNAWRLLVARMNVGILALDATRGELRPAPRSAEGRPSRGLTTIGFCDNPLCPSPMVPKARPSRKCKGCFSFVYCSVSCQKTDWVAQHRKECQPSLMEFYRQTSESSWYNHRTRAYHLAYLETYYTMSSQEMKTYFEPTVLVNFTLERVARVTSPHPADYGFTKPNLCLSPPHESRAEDFCKEMIDAQAKGCALFGECVRYVEVLYPWESNDGLLSLLVKLKGFRVSPSSPMSFKAVYSVARVLYRWNPDHS